MADGKNVGYLRVSSLEQHTDRQLVGVPLDKVFEDKASGKDMARPALNDCLEFLRESDVLHVHEISRLAVKSESCCKFSSVRPMIPGSSAR